VGLGGLGQCTEGRLVVCEPYMMESLLPQWPLEALQPPVMMDQRSQRRPREAVNPSLHVYEVVIRRPSLGLVVFPRHGRVNNRDTE
jgi:hypothetical protein